MHSSPSFSSLAFDEMADPDYTHVAVDLLPPQADADPAAWARSIFSPEALPRWVTGPCIALSRLRRTPRARSFRERFAVRCVAGEEVLIAWDAALLDLRVAVGVDGRLSLLRVVTAMKYKGAGTRALTMPLRLALPFVLRGMVSRSTRAREGAAR